MKVLEISGYTQEFQNQDAFSLAAFTYYQETANKGLELSETMRKSMVGYSDALTGSIEEYTTKRFIENVDQWVIDGIPIDEMLGNQAAAVLFAWNISSNTIPFIENGLSGADSFELAMYSLVIQGDTFLNYLSRQDLVFSDTGSIRGKHSHPCIQKFSIL